ncbi:MAG: hypothetical protein ABIV21_01100 [Pyrinomonadaceae bacterium]
MSRNLFVLFLLVAALSLLGCGGAVENSNSNSNVNRSIVLDPANMPPGLSASPLPVNGSPIPGIPTNGAQLPRGTTPTPGIPNPQELKKGMKKGATPTPGIPDPETLRKAMGQPPSNAGANKPAANVPMMKSTNRPK